MKRALHAWVARVAQIFWSVEPVDLRQRQTALRQEVARILAELAKDMPGNPALDGFKVYSQFDEDGIIESILSRIEGARNFIEIGCGNGTENNTHYLLLKGFKGVWVDGSRSNIQFIRSNLPAADMPGSRLRIMEAMVDAENIQGLVKASCEFIGTDEPDFFSIDIDGNDLHVLNAALPVFRPKVICVEYNCKFPPPLRMAVSYDRNRVWSSDDYMGASLQAFCDALAQYRLVCCNLTGGNAFFVRSDLCAGFETYGIRSLYQPARYELIQLQSGHPATLKWLNDRLTCDRIEQAGTQRLAG